MESLRFGVEEEYLLVDAESRMTVPRAPAVLADAARTLGERAQAEFCATEIEGCTPPLWSSTELRTALLEIREAMASAAARAGCLMVASGTAVLPSPHPLPITEVARYRRMAEMVGPGLADQFGGELCGCHVHVGDLTRAEALAVSGRMRPWLPVLQAIGVNSPFCEGVDGGAASHRAERHANWPTVGPAPEVDERGYERVVRRLVASGTVLDRRSLYWYARPSEHLPTLEVRIADVNADVDITVLLAVLVRGLAQVLLGEVRGGVPAPRVSERLLRAAHRRAARVGLHGSGLDALSGEERPMSRLLFGLVERAAPGLEANGDLAGVAEPATRALAGRTGAQAQRAAFGRRGSLLDVVDQLSAATACGSFS